MLYAHFLMFLSKQAYECLCWLIKGKLLQKLFELLLTVGLVFFSLAFPFLALKN